MNKLKAFWSALPHPVQSVLIAFGTGAGTYFLDNPHFTLSKSSFGAAAVAGLAAVRAFYMLPNKPPAEGGAK